MTEPKILTLDLETSPNLAHVWGLWNQNVGINQLLESGQVISWAAKWYDEDKVLFRSDFHDGHDAMISEMWELLDQADVAIHFNGKRFDMPWLHSEFLLAGLEPYSQVQEIDLLQVVKKRFRFPSNKLAYVTKALGLPTKLATGGHELWIACMAGDPEAWKTMKAYNMQDVVVTEQLYTLIRAWIKGHPHMGLFNGEEFCCQNCGGTKFKHNGRAYTKLAIYSRYKCKTCGVESRGKKALQVVDTRAVA